MSVAEPSAVLFACTYNRIRSPMAAALARRAGQGRLYVDSCGLIPAEDEIDPFAAAVMAEIGVDLAAHDAKTFEELQDGSFDLIVALSPEAEVRARGWAAGKAVAVEAWPTEDPSAEQGTREMRLEAFRRVRDELAARVDARFRP